MDLKARSLELMAERAAEVGLTNVRTHCGSIAGYDGCALPSLLALACVCLSESERILAL